MKIKPIIFGTTGMVGEGVLHECLNHPEVEAVLVVNRRPSGIEHQKLTEIIHQDFHDFSAIETQLTGYNACYFCMGVSSLGMKEADYRKITYDLTMHIAETLVKINPEMTFCYVSGVGTDSTENGRSMWARVKGKTENDLMKLPFRASYMFRPGYIQPTPGLKNAYKIYKIVGPFYPIWNTFFPKYVCTLEQIGLAMINSVLKGSDVQLIEVYNIRTLADKG
jgi:nucleoside-diphosphate-sugar epimerase